MPKCEQGVMMAKKYMFHKLFCSAICTFVALVFVACSDKPPTSDALIGRIYYDYIDSEKNGTWLTFHGLNVRVTGYVIERSGQNVTLCGLSSSNEHLGTARFKSSEYSKLIGLTGGEKVTFDGYVKGTIYPKNVVEIVRCKFVNIDDSDKIAAIKKLEAEEAAFRALTSQDHVSKAKESIRNNSLNVVNMAQKHIDALEENHSQKKSLQSELDRKVNRIKTENEISARKDYAKEIRTHSLDRGRNIKVTTSGAQHDVLRMEWVGFDEVSVYQLQQGSAFSEARKAGFKKIILTDGFGRWWSTEW